MMESFTVLGRGIPETKQDEPVTILALSFRDRVEAAIEYYYTDQQAVTLTPDGVTNDDQTITVRPNADRHVGVLISVIIDVEADAVSLTQTTGAYNYTPFGALNTSNVMLSREWIHRNLILPNSLIFVTRGQPLNLGFSNRIFYNVPVRVTTVMGMMLGQNLNEIMKVFGRKLMDY